MAELDLDHHFTQSLSPTEPEAQPSWRPPTPVSIFVPVAASGVDEASTFESFEELPPPQLDHAVWQKVGADQFQDNVDSKSLSRLLNPALIAEDEGDVSVSLAPGSATRAPRLGRATPALMTTSCSSTSAGVLDGADEGVTQKIAVKSERAAADSNASLTKPKLPIELPASQVDRDRQLAEKLAAESSATGLRKRPRREAAIDAARRMPRMPSPFDLESPPPMAPASSRIASGSKAEGHNGSTYRKVSHSLIERRRRERINECLSHLKRLVPQCREHGEQKILRARERGRKRGRGREAAEEDGDRSGAGLHKLEILQGTILYIEELESRIASFEAASIQGLPGAVVHSRSGTCTPLSDASDPTEFAPSCSVAGAADARPTVDVSRTGNATTMLQAAGPVPSPSEIGDAVGAGSGQSASEEKFERSASTHGLHDSLDAAALLLKFSTSPELQPVRF